ncbi:tail fiber domain-containing protein [Chryseobacterium sp. sg2396]|uniref:tail fiber domain-containing protein n=1 Tax=Chryseobacterium sp. sg2396 TaxID=3276280 RepID=UPI003672E2D3
MTDKNLTFQATSGNQSFFSNANAGSGYYIKNANAGNAAYTYLAIGNDSLSNTVLFMNSSTSTSDAGANGAVLRNDAGDMNIQSQGGKGLQIQKNTGNSILNTSNPGAGGLTIVNPSNDANAYTGFAINNGSSAVNLFLNSVSRTADGGTNGATLRNDAGDINIQSQGANGLTIQKTTGSAVLNTNNAGYGGFSVLNPNTDSNSYTAFALNNGTSALNMFLNSPARTTDGGTNGATMRNDAGDLNLQSKGANGLLIQSTSGNASLKTSNDGYGGLSVTNFNTSSNSFTGFALANGVTALNMFLNSSSRTVDGGINSATLRNDAGDLNMQSKGANGLLIQSITGTSSLNTNSSNYGGFIVKNTNTSATSYAGLTLSNGSTAAFNMFLNSAARTADGGSNAVTLRNDLGSINMQSVGGNGLSIAANTGITTFSNTVITPRVQGPSDRRFKKDITPIYNATEKLNQLNGYTYTWRDRKEFAGQALGEGKDMGVIAQEVEKVFPDAVMTNKDGYKSVNYNALIPVLIEALRKGIPGCRNDQ